MYIIYLLMYQCILKYGTHFRGSHTVLFGAKIITVVWQRMTSNILMCLNTVYRRLTYFPVGQSVVSII